MPRLLNLLPWRRRRLEQDLSRELEDHLLRRIAELTREGVDPVAARRRATLELGGVPQTQEEVRDALVMISAGAALALPAVWALGRLVEAQLYGVTALHAPTILLASGLLAVVALGAAMLPAWRAATVSPTEALRYE